MDATQYFDITNGFDSILGSLITTEIVIVASVALYFIIFLCCIIGLNRKLGDIRELLRQHNDILEENSKATLNKESETISDKTELDS